MFEIGATYSRRDDIHAKFGGQRQGGISTPTESEFVFLFTGEAGQKHGYHDEFAEDGFHMYGEGQEGDMSFVRGNLAIRDHAANGKRLLLFQALGHGKPYAYRGEFQLLRYYTRDDIPATRGAPRRAIVFVLGRVAHDEALVIERATNDLVFPGIDLIDTTKESLTVVRTKQVLFRDNLELVERGCRVTGILDGRFLRASHIKPWAKCETGAERVDGYNGLLLAHHVDHLFDAGWITFSDDGVLKASTRLPTTIISQLSIPSKRMSGFLPFNERQLRYLDYHREYKFKNKQFSS